MKTTIYNTIRLILSLISISGVIVLMRHVGTIGNTWLSIIFVVVTLFITYRQLVTSLQTTYFQELLMKQILQRRNNDMFDVFIQILALIQLSGMRFFVWTAIVYTVLMLSFTGNIW